ncbi:hypothetical protein GCM10011321_01720 [Youhaiella tibetensis]|uniref:Uncharacterized protein n=1 Tax=Paradevosia tibetensis TaxID=1447062 RepID=A0A5B9DT45_9HYPH|nr:hypothetical protein [Youhaiella tibetensis]QEE21608.1 hypothetical protein FNA67_16070 [Youhaiella tibetensis]GGF13324.1 hypothetical protein GCM10011321_01720 [Youhaiella tibetensis]
MRLIALSAAFLTALSGSAFAQVFQGNWYCMAGDQKAGVLTIYNGSYGFASAVYGDKSSGVGAVQGYSDGVTFTDGPLVTELGIQVGRLLVGEGAPSMTIENANAIVMVCTTLQNSGLVAPPQGTTPVAQ